MLYLFFSVLFCVCLITANVLETKQIQIGCLSLTGGLIVFPVSYIINDCVCEVYGYARARLLIWLGFVMNFIFVVFGALADAIPGAPYWNNDEGFHAVFGLAPRIAAASFVAFVVGSFINAYVMSRMKIASRGKHFSLRAVVSTVLGEGIFPPGIVGRGAQCRTAHPHHHPDCAQDTLRGDGFASDDMGGQESQKARATRLL